MEIREKDTKLCFLCMENHEEVLVERKSKTIFKEEELDYNEKVLYCKNTEEFYIPEELIKENDISMKDAYRNKVGLLTSKEIINIRESYGCSQKNIAIILGLGEKTVTRYENHQVQDKAYDNLLRSLSENPLAFKKVLEDKREELTGNSYNKIHKKTDIMISKYDSLYLESSIISEYEGDYDPFFTGNTKLDLKKIIDIINYFGTNIKDLFSVKLMKLLWYSDFYHYRKSGHGISGLCYFKEKMGALPKGYSKIVLLSDIKKESIIIGDNLVDKFIGVKNNKFSYLSDEEIETLRFITRKFKDYSTQMIVDEMHQELAYLETMNKKPINYQTAEFLNL